MEERAELGCGERRVGELRVVVMRCDGEGELEGVSEVPL